MSASPAAPSSLRAQLSGWLALLRLSNAPTIVTNVMAGTCLVAGGSGIHDWMPICVAMLCFYAAGMILNDLCDLRIDRVERPERPLPSGRVSTKAAAVVAALLFFAGQLLTQLNPGAAIASLVLVVLIVVYDLWHKSNPVAPLIMGGCRMMVYLVSGLAVGVGDVYPDLRGWVQGQPSSLLWMALLLLVYVACVTWLASVEARPDKRPARGPGIVLVALPLVMCLVLGCSLVAIVSCAALAAWILYSLSFAFRAQPARVGQCIGHLLAGICLFDAVVIFAFGPPTWGCVAVGLFASTLILHRRISGT